MRINAILAIYVFNTNVSANYSRFIYQPPHHNYCAFQWGCASFIGLDTTALATTGGNGARLRHGALSPGSDQYEFLVSALQKSRDDQAGSLWTVIFMHFPPYVSADYQIDCMRELCPLFDTYGAVDLVFTSHTIVYERSHPIRSGKIDHENGTVCKTPFAYLLDYIHYIQI